MWCEGLLPRRLAVHYAKLRRYGFLLLIILLLVVPMLFPSADIVATDHRPAGQLDHPRPAAEFGH